MFDRYPRYLFIPLNEEGDRELEYGLELNENVLDIPLSEEEIRSLDPLFNVLNKALNIIIGDYEEERIDKESISKAIEIVEPYLEKEEEPFATALRKLLHGLKVAKEMDTYIEFSL